MLEISAVIKDIAVFEAEDGIRVFCFYNQDNPDGSLSEIELEASESQLNDILSAGRDLTAAMVVTNMRNYQGDNQTVKAFIEKHYETQRDLSLNLDTQTYIYPIINIEFRQACVALNAYYSYLGHSGNLHKDRRGLLDHKDYNNLNDDSKLLLEQLDMDIYQWLEYVDEIINNVKRYKDVNLKKYYKRVAKQTGIINRLLRDNFDQCDNR